MTRPRIRSIVEAGLVLAAMGLLALQAQRALHVAVATSAWFVLPIAFVLGSLAADAATGTAHWFCDRFFHETTPLVGEMLIRPFREHHVDPQMIVRHGLLELHGNSAIPVIAALGGIQLLRHGTSISSTDPFPGAFDAFLFVFFAMSMATNQFHMWAHSARTPPAVRWLQDNRVILSPAGHALHHSGDFNRSYCMTSGLLNPLLDRFDLFGHMERGIRALGGGVRR